MYTDYLNKVTDWLSHLDYKSLGWELLVLILAVAGALLVQRTLGRFLLKSSSRSSLGSCGRRSRKLMSANFRTH